MHVVADHDLLALETQALRVETPRHERPVADVQQAPGNERGVRRCLHERLRRPALEGADHHLVGRPLAGDADDEDEVPAVRKELRKAVAVLVPGAVDVVTSFACPPSAGIRCRPES